MEPGKEGCEQSGTYTTLRDPEDGSIIFAHKELEPRLKKEANAEKIHIRRICRQRYQQGAPHRHCRLCPFFAVSENHWRDRLLKHIERHHAQTKFKTEGGAFLGTGVSWRQTQRS